MSDELAYRGVGFVIAALCAIVVPLWVWGPWLFGGASIADLPKGAVPVTAILVILGAWMAVVSALVDFEELQKTLAPLKSGADEIAIVVFLYMLLVGTSALFKKLRHNDVDDT